MLKIIRATPISKWLFNLHLHYIDNKKECQYFFILHFGYIFYRLIYLCLKIFFVLKLIHKSHIKVVFCQFQMNNFLVLLISYLFVCLLRWASLLPTPNLEGCKWVWLIGFSYVFVIYMSIDHSWFNWWMS